MLRLFSVRLSGRSLPFLLPFLNFPAGVVVVPITVMIGLCPAVPSCIEFHRHDAPFWVEDLPLYLILLVSRFGSRDEARKWTDHLKIQLPPGRVLHDFAYGMKCVLETLSLVLMIYDSFMIVLRQARTKYKSQVVLNRVR